MSVYDSCFIPASSSPSLRLRLPFCLASCVVSGVCRRRADGVESDVRLVPWEKGAMNLPFPSDASFFSAIQKAIALNESQSIFGVNLF